MKDCVASFNREINGRPITIDDIKYYVKIEHQRTFKGMDFQIKENQPYAPKALLTHPRCQVLKRCRTFRDPSKTDMGFLQVSS